MKTDMRIQQKLRVLFLITLATQTSTMNIILIRVGDPRIALIPRIVKTYYLLINLLVSYQSI